MIRFENFFNLDDLQNFISDSVNHYYDIDKDMLDIYLPMHDSDRNCFLNGTAPSGDDKTPCPVKLEVSYINNTEEFPLSDILRPDDLRYFSDDALKNFTMQKFIQSVTSFSLTYYVRVDYSSFQDFETSCFDWTIKQMYDYTNRNLVKVTLNLQQANCQGFRGFTTKPIFGANTVLVFVLASISLILTINYFFGIARMYKGIREKYIQKERELKSRAEHFVSNITCSFSVETKL